MEGGKMYPYVDYYKNSHTELWHVIVHFGPDARGNHAVSVASREPSEKKAWKVMKTYGMEQKGNRKKWQEREKRLK